MKIGLRAAGLGLFLGLCFSAMSGVTQSPAIQTTGEPQADAGLTVLAHLPKLLSGGEPEYPSDAMAARVEASIIVRVNINEKGEVATAGIVGLRQRYGSITDQGKGWSAEVLRAHNSLCQAALNSVLGRRYQPTTLDDKAVPVLATEIIDFRLDNKGGLAGQPAREPVPIDGRIMGSKLLTKVDPVYPELAIRAGVQGTSRLEVLVDERGEVARVRIIASGHPLLPLAAVDAVKQWRYCPTYLEGRAVPIITTVNVPFDLQPILAFATPSQGEATAPRANYPESIMRTTGQVEPSFRVEPEYPAQALGTRNSGIVLLTVVVDDRGMVYEAIILRGPALFLQAALNAVSQWRFQPLTANGQPAPFVTTVTLTFNPPR